LLQFFTFNNTHTDRQTHTHTHTHTHKHTVDRTPLNEAWVRRKDP